MSKLENVSEGTSQVAKTATRCANKVSTARSLVIGQFGECTVVDSRELELRTEIGCAAKEVALLAGATLLKCKRIGECLLVIRNRTKHGEWEKKLQGIASEYGFSIRTAQLYIQIHSNWGLLETLPVEKLESLSLHQAQKIVGSLVRETGSKAAREVQSFLTPAPIIERTLQCFKGSITLDPAAEAERKHVPAELRYDESADGLSEENPWVGSVFLHPPHDSALVGPWIDRLARETKGDEVEEAILFLPLLTLGSEFATLLSLSPSLILVQKSLEFGGRNQAKPPFIVAYVGERHDDFSRAFSDVAPVLRPSLVGPRSSELPSVVSALPSASVKTDGETS